MKMKLTKIITYETHLNIYVKLLLKLQIFIIPNTYIYLPRWGQSKETSSQKDYNSNTSISKDLSNWTADPTDQTDVCVQSSKLFPMAGNRSKGTRVWKCRAEGGRWDLGGDYSHRPATSAPVFWRNTADRNAWPAEFTAHEGSPK